MLIYHDLAGKIRVGGAAGKPYGGTDDGGTVVFLNHLLVDGCYGTCFNNLLCEQIGGAQLNADLYPFLCQKRCHG